MLSFVNKVLNLSAAFGFYDRWAGRSLGGVYDTLVALADLGGGEEVLDVGCGTGMLSLRLAGASHGIRVQGVDIGPRMIAVAKKKARRQNLRVEYILGTAAQLPYLDAQFDVVSSCLLFHLLHGSDKEEALREIYRVLRPGGRYVCAEFETYPVRFLWGRLLTYPNDLVGRVGFSVGRQSRGPTITKCRPIVYRTLRKPMD